jgi:hypothetical protein
LIGDGSKVAVLSIGIGIPGTPGIPRLVGSRVLSLRCIPRIVSSWADPGISARELEEIFIAAGPTFASCVGRMVSDGASLGEDNQYALACRCAGLSEMSSGGWMSGVLSVTRTLPIGAIYPDWVDPIVAHCARVLLAEICRPKGEPPRNVEVSIHGVRAHFSGMSTLGTLLSTALDTGQCRRIKHGQFSC